MKFRLLLWPTVFAVPVLVVLVGLGNWQTERLYWKQDLIEKVKDRTAQTPTPLPALDEWTAMIPEQSEYQPFSVTGRFDHANEFHVFTSLSQPKGRFKGPGYWVLTPLLLDEGGVVVINRGYVPVAYKEASSRAPGQIAGTVEVSGLYRKPETQEMFVPDNNTENNIWYFRDVSGMARQMARDNVAPFVLDELANDVPGGLPQAGETRLEFKNTHLQYAVTWYGLALCLIGVYFAYHISYNRSLNFGRDD